MPEGLQGESARRAVFLDRDGTINEEREYLHRVEEFRFIDGVPRAIARLNDAGFLVLVVTNQSGVARGYYDLAAVERLHRHIDAELASRGARVDGWYVCPHHPREGVNEHVRPCDCRKPLPGMLLQGAGQFGLDLQSCFMVGDKEADVAAALAAGCTPILVRTGYGAALEASLPAGVTVADDLAAAVELIMAQRADASAGEDGTTLP
jgi:D-glycero-D-manno-heptose 1,7-bisphosphate phosphatase